MSDTQKTTINMVDSLIGGVEKFISTKTVVGEPQIIEDTVIIPLVDVTFGIGAGASSGSKGDNGCGGVGAKMSPNAVLIIKNGNAKVINIKNQDAATKFMDMIPDLVAKFTVPKNEEDSLTTEQAVEKAFPENK